MSSKWSVQDLIEIKRTHCVWPNWKFGYRATCINGEARFKPDTDDCKWCGKPVFREAYDPDPRNKGKLP